VWEEVFLMTKRVAVYGTYEAKRRVWVKERVLKTRRDGIKQHYWVKREKVKTVEDKGRYEFFGSGREIYEAVRLAHTFMPKGFVTVSARKFLENPAKYGVIGEWIEKEIESP
jgi:hypothetical protein